MASYVLDEAECSESPFTHTESEDEGCAQQLSGDWLADDHSEVSQELHGRRMLDLRQAVEEARAALEESEDEVRTEPASPDAEDAEVLIEDAENAGRLGNIIRRPS